MWTRNVALGVLALLLVIVLACVGLTGAVEQTADVATATAGESLSSDPAASAPPAGDPRPAPSAAATECITFDVNPLETFDRFGPTFDEVYGEGEKGAEGKPGSKRRPRRRP